MLLQKISKKISYVLASIVLMTAQMTPFFVFSPKVSADGNGSPVACLDTTPNVAGSIEGTDDVVVYNAGAGFVVDGVCIKSGNDSVEGEKHSGVLGNGTYENSCYTVIGVGTQQVTVSRVGDGSDCKGISHIDAVLKPVNGSIKVIKDSQPNSSDDFDFTLKKGQTTVASFELEDDGDNGDGKSDNKTTDNLTTGTYVVTESPEESGWVLHDIVCGGGGNTTKDVANKKVTIVLATNENVVCTFVNKPAPQYGNVKVNKWTDLNGDGDYTDNNEKDNSNANSLGFLWGLDADVVNNQMGNTQENVLTGQHAVNENSIAGFELIGWHKSGDNKSCDRDLPVTVDIRKNDNTDITLCNKKIPKGTLVLIKEVKKDNGGSASQNAWTLNANGPESVSGMDDSPSTDTGYLKEVLPGKYVLSESNGPAGYKLDSIMCKIDNGNWSTLDSKKEIEVKKDKVTKCVFKNNDIVPSLTLVKQVVNSNKPVTEWTLKASGEGQDLTNLSGNGSVSSDASFKAGTYTLSETGPTGFDASPWTCTGVTVNGNNQITLGLGQTTTCTITNTAKPVTIVATKIVCNDESLLPNWGGGNGPNITANTALRWVGINDGCELTEGWNFEYALEKALAVNNPGDNIEVGGTGWTVFGLTDANGQTSTQINDVSGVNKIWVREQLKDGYFGFTYNVAGNNNDDISAEIYCNQDVLNYDNFDFVDRPLIGSTYYCVAWNVEEKGRVEVTKFNDANNNGEWDDNEETLPDWEMLLTPRNECVGFTILVREEDDSPSDCDDPETTEKETNEDGVAIFENVKSGWYTVGEDDKAGWDQTVIYCDDDRLDFARLLDDEEETREIWVGVGQTVRCYIGNYDTQGGGTLPDKTGTIIVTKFNDMNKNKVWDKDSGELALQGWEIVIERNGTTHKKTTGADGTVTFSDLELGNYKVTETPQSGWSQSVNFCKENSNEECVVGAEVPVECFIGNYETTGQVLGDSTTIPNTTKPQVLGATTTLAVTGDSQSSYMVATGLTLIAATLVVASNRRRETVFTK